MQSSGGAPEVTLLGDGHEVPQVAHIGARHDANVIGLDMIRVGVGRGLFGPRRGHGEAVKLVWFHLMPYPKLPEDFNQKHRSVWVDIDPACSIRK